MPPYEIDPELKILKYFESDKIHVTALIVADYTDTPSHWNSSKTLSEWLIEQGVPALYGIDTRLLTKKIRDKGALLGLCLERLTARKNSL